MLNVEICRGSNIDKIISKRNTSSDIFYVFNKEGGIEFLGTTANGITSVSLMQATAWKMDLKVSRKKKAKNANTMKKKKGLPGHDGDKDLIKVLH